VRGRGVWRDGDPVTVVDRGGLADSIVAISGMPAQPLDWNQFRALGSIALSLCDLAAGHLDGYLDAVGNVGPWDYLAGMLAVQEAGGRIVDASGRDLAITDPRERRQVLAASHQGLLDELRGALAPGA
jgi:myo-inositol-1(or 4)-monophosphatase